MTSPVFLSARWVDLAMINFAVDPAALAARVPAGTELDSFDRRTYVSMVGFRFLDTRVLGWPVPGHRHFDEVNLRFYVRREVGGELRRGVCFIKEIVPKPAVAWIARRLYGEKYVSMPMRHRIDRDGTRPRARYEWRVGGGWNTLAVEGTGEPAVPPQGSLASFIAEHYWGYARQRDGSTVEYRVEHPAWEVWDATSELRCDVTALYGSEFRDPLSRPAASAFLAVGSPVLVRRGVRLPE